MKFRRVVVVATILFSFIATPQSAEAGLFSFLSHTFTPCGAVAVSGPTTANCTSAYSATTWASNATYFSTSSGKQIFTIPGAGSYRVTVAGAVGGAGPTKAGGKGAILRAEFTFTQGTTLTMLVGQSGTTGNNGSGGGAGGGGGGSFLYNTTSSTLLVVAGGGGGAGKNLDGLNASTTVNGLAGGSGSTGGTLNAGGSGISTYNPYYGGGGGGATTGNGSAGSGGGGLGGGGGAGYTGDGGAGNNSSITSKSFTNGGTGSYQSYSGYGSTTQAAGGFGGGGTGTWMEYIAGGGGGGGYTGGGGGNGTGSDAYAGTGGGGGGSYISGSNQTTSVTNASTGYITIELVAPLVTSFVARTPITNNSYLNFDITFSENVTGFGTDDYIINGTGGGSCLYNSVAGSNQTYAITLTSCSPGQYTVTLNANSIINGNSITGPATTSTSSAAVIDQTAPTISSVVAPSNKTYIPSDTPTFTATFSESITVTGAPRLTLTVGSQTKYANFVSMTDSKTALFRYTVATASGEFDTDGIAVTTTLDLNGGSITDLAANALALTFSAPTLTSVLVAQPASAPTITSIAATSTQLDINFTAGASNGASITNYQYSLNSGAWTNRASGTTASPLTITGLINGTPYAVRLRAINAAGSGDSSTAVTETPTSVFVSGDSTLVITYGGNGSTGAYSATGGTGSYTWSLGTVLSGITLSATTVTAGSTTPAGTYTQTVRATDGNSQVGSKTLTITVSKATTSIAIALPNSVSSASLGGAVTITAAVTRAGAVNFKLGGVTISGCASASAVSMIATCSWTPGALGSVSLTAIFTPTDTSNFETSTSTTLSITVVNGVSSVTLSLTGGVTQVPKGTTINIIAAVDQAGKLTILIDGKRLVGCFNKSASVGNVICAWKPAVQKQVNISSTLNPTNTVYNNSSSSLKVWVIRRSGTR